LLLFFHFLFGHLKFLYENIPKPNCSRVCWGVRSWFAYSNMRKTWLIPQ
jgi:hypothetical protein